MLPLQAPSPGPATQARLLRRRAHPHPAPALPHPRSRRWLLVLRGVLGFCSVSSLFLAVSLLPLADASVLSFLSPLFVAAFRWVLQHPRCSLGAQWW